MESREAVVARLLRPFRMGRFERRVIHYRKVRQSLWTVEHICHGDRPELRIVEYEIAKYFGHWGFVARCEGQILHSSCPLAFLQGLPVKDSAWRETVMAYHLQVA